MIKSSKAVASFWNSITYTFSAIVVKFIADYDLWIAITVQAITNYVGCYGGMYLYEMYEKNQRKNLEKSK